MRLKFLGTAAAEGWPALFCQCDSCAKARANGGKNIRTRSSSLIDDSYMIDFSADTYMHVLYENIDLTKVEHLFITHSHEDHFYPEDLMLRRPPYAHLNVPSRLTIYGNSSTKALYDAVNAEDADDVLEFKEIVAYNSFKAGDAIVTPLLANHIPDEDCFIYLIELNGKKLLYGHDSGYFPEATWDALKGHVLDAVTLDCTMGPESCERYHMGFPQNIRVKDRLIAQGNADANTIFIINHFSHNGGLLHDELVKMAKPHGFQVSYDGMEVQI